MARRKTRITTYHAQQDDITIRANPRRVGWTFRTSNGLFLRDSAYRRGLRRVLRELRTWNPRT